MKSKVYRDLTPLKLNQVTIDDIDTLRAGMYAQGRKNKSQYADLQQVAVASNQQGGSGSVLFQGHRSSHLYLASMTTNQHCLRQR